MLVKYRMQKLLLETEKSSATVRNLYHIAHVATGTSSFGGIRWCHSNVMLLSMSISVLEWTVFAQRTAGEVHYQEQ